MLFVENDSYFRREKSDGKLQSLNTCANKNLLWNTNKRIKHSFPNVISSLLHTFLSSTSRPNNFIQLYAKKCPPLHHDRRQSKTSILSTNVDEKL